MREGWEKKTLGEVIALNYGKPLPKADRDENGAYPAYGANGVLCRTNIFYYDEPSIIVGRKGSAGETRLTDRKFWPLDVTYFVTFDKRKYDIKYLYLCLQSLQLPCLAKGVKPGINRNDVYRIELYFPPLAEQERIVAILDAAFESIDRAIANTEKNLANTRELFKQSLTERIFGDPDARGWSSVLVHDLAHPEKGSIRTGPFGSQLLHSEFVDEGVAVLGIDNAVNNEFRWAKQRYITKQKYADLSRYTVKPGDVLITIMGTCGRCAVVPDGIPLAINTKHLCCITLDQTICLPEFLHAYFLYHPVAKEFLSSNAKGAIMAGLNMGLIKALPVRIPAMQEQKDIVRDISNLQNLTNNLQSTYRQKLEHLAELKQSILQKAFAGELTADYAANVTEEAIA